MVLARPQIARLQRQIASLQQFIDQPDLESKEAIQRTCDELGVDFPLSVCADGLCWLAVRVGACRNSEAVQQLVRTVCPFHWTENCIADTLRFIHMA